MSLDILRFPATALQKTASAVQEQEISGELEDLIDRMQRIMTESKGVGLAAPQIGILKRVIVFLRQSEATTLTSYMINPELVYASPEFENSIEGCLSIPRVFVGVKRSKSITVKYQQLDSSFVTENFSGDVANIVQHEIDHLNGITLMNKLSKSERRKVLSDLARIK